MIFSIRGDLFHGCVAAFVSAETLLRETHVAIMNQACFDIAHYSSSAKLARAHECLSHVVLHAWKVSSWDAIVVPEKAQVLSSEPLSTPQAFLPVSEPNGPFNDRAPTATGGEVSDCYWSQ